MQNKPFGYRLYGRSKGRNKKNFDYDKFNLILKKFAIHKLSVSNNILDIGSGYGESALYLAQKNNNAQIIACEKFIDGNIKLIKNINKKKLTNLFIYNGNAVQLLDQLDQNEYFSEIWILFPDPWPKKKTF